MPSGARRLLPTRMMRKQVPVRVVAALGDMANPLVTAIIAFALVLLFWPVYAFARDRMRQPVPAGGR